MYFFQICMYHRVNWNKGKNIDLLKSIVIYVKHFLMNILLFRSTYEIIFIDLILNLVVLLFFLRTMN